MNNIEIKVLAEHEYKNNLDRYIEELAYVYGEEESERIEGFKKFWYNWFNEKISGNKVTTIALDHNKAVGTARFWQSPYCDNKWSIKALK